VTSASRTGDSHLHAVKSQVPVPPKHIEVDGHRIRHREFQQVLWLAACGALAICAVSAVYYDITQVYWHVGHFVILNLRYSWNHLFPSQTWPVWRHSVGRAIFEGIVADFLLKWLVSGLTGKSWKKRPMQRVRVWSIPLIALGVLILGLALAVCAQWFVMFGYPMLAHQTTHVHYVTPAASIAEAEGFVIGVIIGELVHRLWRPAANTIHLMLADRGVAYAQAHDGKLPVWVRHPLTPPSERERVAWMVKSGIKVKPASKWIHYPAIVAGLVFLALAVQGFDIRVFIAR
jgi:hypothetical protein